MEWMILPYKRYFDFSGRSQRQEYWMFQLFWVLILIVGVVLIVAGVVRATDTGGSGSELSPLGWLGVTAMGLFVLGSIIPMISVTVRRFHDQNLSGWLYLLNFIPSVGGLIVFVFMCLDGTGGPNRFGLDPKGRGEAGVFE